MAGKRPPCTTSPRRLRHWRRSRRLSPLDLASEAEVAPRHLAFLETGRARPSRGMVRRLAKVMGQPHGDPNGVLAAAGFAPQFPVLPPGAAEMAQVRAGGIDALDRAAEEVARSDVKIELMCPADAGAEAALARLTRA